MSWSDLERLVADAENNQELQQTLSQCRSRQELLRTARQLGYRVTKSDLHNAWLEHHNAPAANGAGGADRWAAGGS
ncbi:Nif11-like leader peptide family natural product precursor [Cyanobium sp. Aljojuca 7D2]|uniref:Nif11-like leader peptide family natural product precursor n=1 Tax=Cyanobium sp. Aljojuca 7D2 TaxID=2823698 RepID=UPI0020CD38A4|nr:Nif11-like leader peptide family natural product precursor [Cyanobium sp. Aljojuca 7D2]MCP9891446.1 Nif11-like leader peptide family natural product precursor [Cyanobium sp. Aljojuca 7D2]